MFNVAALPLLLALFAGNASAQAETLPIWPGGDLWILPTAIACVAQYPELSNTHLGILCW